MNVRWCVMYLDCIMLSDTVSCYQMLIMLSYGASCCQMVFRVIMSDTESGWIMLPDGVSSCQAAVSVKARLCVPEAETVLSPSGGGTP
jgi:hypothetical protein